MDEDVLGVRIDKVRNAALLLGISLLMTFGADWLRSSQITALRTRVEALQVQVNQLRTCPDETGETTDP